MKIKIFIILIFVFSCGRINKNKVFVDFDNKQIEIVGSVKRINNIVIYLLKSNKESESYSLLNLETRRIFDFSDLINTEGQRFKISKQSKNITVTIYVSITGERGEISVYQSEFNLNDLKSEKNELEEVME